jgi:hypothetical protein
MSCRALPTKGGRGLPVVALKGRGRSRLSLPRPPPKPVEVGRFVLPGAPVHPRINMPTTLHEQH